jgi:hypothetical protein
VVGWYLPVRVVSEKALTRAGVRVVVQTRRVAVGRSVGAYAQAVKEWCTQTMNRKVLVGITGRLVHADGQEEVLVMGGEVWEEWTGQAVEGTDWRKVYHTKVLSGTKKERNQWVFVVVKGILGQRYYDRSKIRFQN